MGDRPRAIALLAAAVVVYFILGTRFNPAGPYYPYTQAVVVVFIAVTEVSVVATVTRRQGEPRSTLALYLVVRELELNAELWPSLEFRNHICMRLYAAARSAQAIPLRTRKLSPSVRPELRTKARAKAQALRHLELWAMQPGPFTFTDLVDRLVADVRLLATGRWYDLPEAPYERQPSIGRAILLVVLALALVAGSFPRSLSYSSIVPSPRRTSVNSRFTCRRRSPSVLRHSQRPHSGTRLRRPTVRRCEFPS